MGEISPQSSAKEEKTEGKDSPKVIKERINNNYGDEVDPTMTHYRLPNSRPTVAQIRTGKHKVPKISVPKQEGATHTVGTIVGVLSPCFVNIVNIIYFSRLPFVVGTAGGMPTLIGLIISTILVGLSVFSLSAMATNGEMEMGGAYYLVSRTIGPEFGGACGLCLAFAGMLGAAQASIGMIESVVILYQPFTCFGAKIWDVRVFSSISSLIIALLSKYGFPIRMAIFIMIWIGVIMYFLGLLFPQYTKAKDLISCSRSRFADNWRQEEVDVSNFFYTFSIIFPGFGGILAGSNSSGNLKRPQLSIPLGSFLALGFGVFIFIATAMTLVACHPREQLISTWSSPIQDSSLFSWFVFIAAAGSSIGKGVTGLGSGPMVLRTMATDGLIPNFFNEHSRKFGAIFAVVFCMWGDFNQISSLSSSLFLSVFAILNFGVYLVKSAKVISFRPHFSVYFPQISLVASIACIVSIFFINYITAIIALIAAALFYYYTWKKHLNLPWGSLTQSYAYNNGLKAALRLRHVPPHPKLYRPNVVLLIKGPPSEHQIVITFLDQMLHGKGLAIVARVFDESTPLVDVIEERKNCPIITKSKDYNIFYETVVAKNEEEALMKVMLLSGLGALRANVVFVEFDEQCKQETAIFIQDVLDRHWSIVILRNPYNIDEFGIIDCWCLCEDGGLELLLASILASSDQKLRVLTFAREDLGEDKDHHYKIISHIIKKFRISAEVIIVPFTDSQLPSHHSQVLWNNSMEGVDSNPALKEQTLHFMRISDMIRAYSSHSMVAVVSLPKPPFNVPGEIYMRWLGLISTINPSVLFVRGNGTHALSWQL